MRLSATRSEYNMQQNTKVMDQFIKAQDRRDLDPALMDIPTFTGRNQKSAWNGSHALKTCVDNQDAHFNRRLTNKSGLVVQNFLSALDRRYIRN